jgi:hypothetical protein
MAKTETRHGGSSERPGYPLSDRPKVSTYSILVEEISLEITAISLAYPLCKVIVLNSHPLMSH